MLDDRYIQRSNPHIRSQSRRLARSEFMPRACHALESCQRSLGLSNAARGLFSPCALAARAPMKSTFAASAPAGSRVAWSSNGRHTRSTYPDPPTSPAPRKTPWLGRLEKRPSLFRPFTLHAVGTVGSTPHARAAAALRHRPCLRPDGSSAARCQAGAVACIRRLQRSDGSSFPVTTSSEAGAPWWVGAVAGAGAVGLQWCCSHLATASASHKLAGNAPPSQIAHRSHLRAFPIVAHGKWPAGLCASAPWQASGWLEALRCGRRAALAVSARHADAADASRAARRGCVGPAAHV